MKVNCFIYLVKKNQLPKLILFSFMGVSAELPTSALKIVCIAIHIIISGCLSNFLYFVSRVLMVWIITPNKGLSTNYSYLFFKKIETFENY